MGRYRRYVIALAIIVVVLGLYAAAGFLGVPYLARKNLQSFVHDHYGRTLALGDIRFNPFTLNLELTKLSLPDADGQPLLAFERLQVDLQWATLWRLGPSFGTILLEEPYVRVVIRRDGALNLADLGKGFAPAPAPPPAQNSKPMRLYIGRLAVIAGTTALEDRTRPTPFRAELKPIGFELRDFSTTANTGDAYALYATSPAGERLTWNGTLHTSPFASRGAFEIAALKAHTVWTYLRDSVPFELDSGVINIKGDYEVASPAGAPLQVSVGVGSIAVTQLGVKPRGGPQHYIDVARIEVDGTRIDVAKHAVNVAKVELSGGDIRAWLEQGKLNLMQLVPGAGAAAAPGAAAGAAPPPPAAASPRAWSVQVPDISVTGFKVSAEDRQVNPAAAVVLQPLNLHVAGFNLSPGDTLDVALDAGVNGSGKLRATAKVTPTSGALSAHVESSDLGLAMLQPYIGQYTSMTLLKGALGVKLDVERLADGALTVRGDTRVVDLRTVDNALHQDFIKWKDLHVAGIRYASAPASLKIGTVTAVEPYVRMIIAPDRSVNITRVLTPPGAAPKPAVDAPETSAPPAAAAPRQRDAGKAPPPAPPSKPLTPFPMTIGTVRLVNGAANYTDLWIKPSFAIGIQALGGTVTGLSSDPRSRAKVQLDGKIDRYSPWHLGGEVNVLSAALFTDLTMSFKDVDLTVVNPYSGRFAGYKIDKGKLSVDVTYKIDQRKLDAKQHFVVDQLELGERVESPDAVHLPLKIAVALLKDRHGVIDLDLPMNGSLDDPKFRIGPIIWKVFVNLITKAATAPFALLGHLFGGSEHMNVVEFAPGSAELDKPAQDQLTALVKALNERPQLKLDVPIVYSKTVDRPQLAAARLQQELLTRVASSHAGRKHPDTAGETALADPARHYKLLYEQFQADLGKDAQLPPSVVAVEQAKRKDAPYEAAINDLDAALINHVDVPDADLEALGKQRAQAIQDALLAGGQVEASRIFIVNAAPKAEGGDKVKVELAVK
ncbi:MAG TPA: DUF748 domain-containing protein [Steroidobacteraceae bacterium]